MEDFSEMKAHEFGKLQELLARWGSACPDFTVGETLLVRTVTYYWVGKITKVTARFLHMTDASWIADAGKYGETFLSGKIPDSQKIAGVHRIAIAAVVDASPWNHPLPTK